MPTPAPSFWTSLFPSSASNAQLFTRAVLIILVLSYAVLLMWSSLAADDFLLLGKLDKKDVVIFGVGFIMLLLIRPAVTLADTVSDIYSKVSKLTHPSVTVEQHHDAGVVATFTSRFKVATVFLGFPDASLLQQIIALIGDSSHQYDLYINPSVVPLCARLGLLSDKVYVVSCPPESCVVFAYDPEARLHCLTLRCIPHHRTCWSVSIEPQSPFAVYLRETFSNYFQGDRCVSLDTRFMANFLNKINRDRLADDRSVRDRILNFHFPQEGYLFVTDLVKEARNSVYALDFMSPSRWAADRILRDYERAHGQSTATIKQRIHVFKKALLVSNVSDYKEYVSRHLSFGIQLFFMDEDVIRGPNIGFLILDEEVAFISEREEKLDEWHGRIDFNAVGAFMERYRSVIAHSPTEITSPDDIDRMNALITGSGPTVIPAAQRA